MIFVLIPQSCGGGQWVEHNNELRMEWLKIENEQKMMEDNKDSNISDGNKMKQILKGYYYLPQKTTVMAAVTRFHLQITK